MKIGDIIRVLLIEDEPGDAGLVQIGLRHAQTIKFDIQWVETLADAKAAVSQNRFDVLLLDLSLPDSTGLDTLQRAQSFALDIPIIVLTGQNDVDFALTALKEGVADYLVKGDFSDDSLERSIRHTLHRTEVEAHNRLLIAALEAAANGIVITDRGARIKWANSAFSRLTGYDLAEAIGHKPAELVKSGLQSAEFYEAMWETLLAGKNWRGEVVNKRKDGSLYHEELSIAPVLNKAGTIEHFVGIKEDISSRKQMEEQLQKLANTDPLTGLYNRRVFMEKLEDERRRLKRLERPPAALLMMDLDFFKRINDVYGHATGDDVLRNFADILKTTLRNIDLSARLGGEEFAVLLPGTDKIGALAIAERLRSTIANAGVEHPSGKVYFTVSIGMAALSKDDSDCEKVLYRADAALYKAKEQGRNRCSWYESMAHNVRTISS